MILLCYGLVFLIMIILISNIIFLNQLIKDLENIKSLLSELTKDCLLNKEALRLAINTMRKYQQLKPTEE